LIGANLRFSTVFSLPLEIYFGPELAVNYYNDSLSAGLNLLAEKWFTNERLALSFRFGVLFPIFSIDPFNVLLSDATFIESIIVNSGIYCAWRVTNRMLLEVGMNYQHKFHEVSSGGFIPWVGIGVQW